MKSVVICGSRKFKSEIEDFSSKLSLLGASVFGPNFESNHSEWEKISKEYQKYVVMGLTFDHIQKIRMADTVFIFNKDGYSGVSVTLELGCAIALNKPIYAFAHDQEICRQVLFREVISSPEELITKLK